MSGSPRLHLAPTSAELPRRPVTQPVALVIHGLGEVTHIAATELARDLERAGWFTCIERANPGHARPTQHVDLVVGIDADIAAFRAAAAIQAPVLTARRGDRLAVDGLLDSVDDLSLRTSPLGIAKIDRDAAIPVVQRAIVTAADPDGELVWKSPITHQPQLERITHIAVDVPEPIDRGPGSRTHAGAMGAVMTFRSAHDASWVLLHPDDDYSITTRDGTDIVIQIDQHIHQRARRVHLGAHPTGLRLVHLPTNAPT